MFYLLEDNRIIDSEKCVISKIIEYEKYKIITFREKDDFFYTTDKIKKQSENVFDLIDWEKDLVKHKINNFIWHCSVLNQTSDILEHIKNRTITVIYKLDAKGNYIKVWEKKDE